MLQLIIYLCQQLINFLSIHYMCVLYANILYANIYSNRLILKN
jgi:hypothetical protein